ncbi:hypothetical protein BR93DRAFT_930520 [Coniochaeta sp. PMI_546]|nr:hypothetical protein BR93DRAFT_930520 [Coniochaeta sp. PMI_546]
MDVSNPTFLSFFPKGEKILSKNLHWGADGWIVSDNITSNNTFFRTQWMQCGYQISGSYGALPRYIFYALAIVSLLGRRKSWVVGVALGSVMVYSATAAIHALVLASIRTKMAPDAMLANYEVVRVEGTSPSGSAEDVYTNVAGSAWIPVLPMAWDNDDDPVVAITGCAFLLLLPMQIWSKSLEQAQLRRKGVVLAWAVLLFAGLIAGLVNEAYLSLYAFPQVRFCPMDREDALPFVNPGFEVGVPPWDYVDWYRWNRTIRDYFIDGTGPGPVGLSCFYPCFGTSWPLRDTSEIYAVQSGYGAIFDGDVGYGLLFVVYVLVGASSVSSLTVALLLHLPHIRDNWRPLGIRSSFDNLKAAWRSTFLSPWGRAWRAVLRLWIMWNLFVAKVLAPIIIIEFVVTFEWII